MKSVLDLSFPDPINRRAMLGTVILFELEKLIVDKLFHELLDKSKTNASDRMLGTFLGRVAGRE